MPKTQSAASHAATDTITHFVLLPIFTLNFAFAIYHAAHDPQHRTLLNLWLIVLAIALFLLNAKTRLYTLRIQDRVIRLEEHLRLAALAPTVPAISLTTPQLIALRFASGPELPTLAQRTLTENLTPKQIKESIITWRPDNARV